MADDTTPTGWRVSISRELRAVAPDGSIQEKPSTFLNLSTVVREIAELETVVVRGLAACGVTVGEPVGVERGLTQDEVRDTVAEVRSAVPLTPEQVADLREWLRANAFPVFKSRRAEGETVGPATVWGRVPNAERAGRTVEPLFERKITREDVDGWIRGPGPTVPFGGTSESTGYSQPDGSAETEKETPLQRYARELSEARAQALDDQETRPEPDIVDRVATALMRVERNALGLPYPDDLDALGLVERDRLRGIARRAIVGAEDAKGLEPFGRLVGFRNNPFAPYGRPTQAIVRVDKGLVAEDFLTDGGAPVWIER